MGDGDPAGHALLGDLDRAPVGEGRDHEVGHGLDGLLVVERRGEQLAGPGEELLALLGRDPLGDVGHRLDDEVDAARPVVHRARADAVGAAMAVGVLDREDVVPDRLAAHGPAQGPVLRPQLGCRPPGSPGSRGTAGCSPIRNRMCGRRRAASLAKSRWPSEASMRITPTGMWRRTDSSRSSALRRWSASSRSRRSRSRIRRSSSIRGVTSWKVLTATTATRRGVGRPAPGASTSARRRPRRRNPMRHGLRGLALEDAATGQVCRVEGLVRPRR